MFEIDKEIDIVENSLFSELKNIVDKTIGNFNDKCLEIVDGELKLNLLGTFIVYEFSVSLALKFFENLLKRI